MRRKLLAPFMLVFVTVLAVSSYWPDAENEYEDDFTLDAVFYPELQILEISFKDDTGMISNSMMQILGLHDPFMRQYEGAAFTETVEFSAEPEYGWKAHPIIVRFDHPQYGEIGIKTEAHTLGQPIPPLVYEST